VILDTANLMSSYLFGIQNVLLLLQWGQVYKVLKYPEKASSSFLTNWAETWGCVYAVTVSILVLGSFYVDLYIFASYGQIPIGTLPIPLDKA